jgi:Protein of unknown function (DUF2442)
MNPRVKDVKPNSGFILTVTFTNGEVGTFDVNPYLKVGVFQELNEPGLFNSVKVFMGSVQWQNCQDFCPDTLYLQSKKQQRNSSALQVNNLRGWPSE